MTPPTTSTALHPHVSALFDVEHLMNALEDGLVKAQTHPDDPSWAVWNYTDLATYSKAWTPVTTACRGLVLDGSARVMSRPFPKFWNVAEHEEGALDLSAPVEVTEKLDGSMGHLYTGPDGLPAIATRGSFASEQALWATTVYRAGYADAWTPVPGWTYVFEILYAENRIVVDYGGREGLFLLGAVEIATGRTVGPCDDITQHWPGERADIHEFGTLAEALAAPQRDNAEGYVIRYLGGPLDGTRTKLKHDRYVYLHRILTGLTARRLWESVAVWDILNDEAFNHSHRSISQALRLDPKDLNGIVEAGPAWLDEIRRTCPEEFVGWVDSTIDRLRAEAKSIDDQVSGQAIKWSGHDRKAIALGIAEHPYRGLVFAAIDGKPTRAKVWAQVRPAAEKPFVDRGEANA